MRLSIILPVLNEAGIDESLLALAPLRRRGTQIVVCDGGSSDDTAARAASGSDRVIVAPRGRGSQMNAGAAVATGDALLFLHADTRLPPDADKLILSALAQADWGRFDVAIDGAHPILPVIAWFMNRRSRLTGIATGDQALFMTRAAFESAGGFPDIALMEDIAMSAKLKRLSPPACLAARVTTSGRRWEKYGIARTILTMWTLRVRFFFGADPDELARAYGYRPRNG